MFDLTNILTISNSLLTLGILVFVGSIVVIILLFGASSTETLKSVGSLAIIFGFSVSVPLVFSQISPSSLTSRASQKVTLKKNYFDKINPQAYRLVYDSTPAAACYLEYQGSQTKKISVVFTTNGQQKNLTPETKHEFLIFDNSFILNSAVMICDGNRFPLKNVK